MKRALLLSLGSLLLFTGCVTRPQITPAQFPRVGLISAYPDELTLSVAGSYFGLSKDNVLPLPGLGQELSGVFVRKLTAAGYRVSVLPVSAERFWATFATAARTDEGSGWHLGVKKNTSVTLDVLRKEGLDLSGIDAVVVVGPSQFYQNARFLSRKGTGLEFAFVAKTPDKVGAALGANATAFDVRTLQFTGFANEFLHWGMIPFSGDDLANLTPEARARLLAYIAEKSAPMFESLARDI